MLLFGAGSGKLGYVLAAGPGFPLDTGELIDLERVWPACARRPISEADFRMREGRRRWAQKAAPDSAYANRGQKYDPLSSSNPLPFQEVMYETTFFHLFWSFF